MTGKYHSYLKTFLRLFLVAGMAVVIPVGCGGSEGVDDIKEPPSPVVKTAPSITLLQSEVCVFGGAKVEQLDSSLLIGGEKVAEWKAGSGKMKKVSLAFNGTAISHGTVLSEKGTLVLRVTNDAEKSANSNISLTDEAVAGLNALQQLLQVDKEVDLIENLTFARGFKLAKTEIEFEGKRTEIADAAHFTPEYPGSCTLFFSVKKNEAVNEVRAENLTIKPLEYKAMEIGNIKPVDILPVIGQVTLGDREVYSHVEHLRLAEATRVREMMRKYGTDKHSPEEYQKLLSRLNTGLTNEAPYGNNLDRIGKEEGPSMHANNERTILNILLNHANLKVVSGYPGIRSNIEGFIKEHPNDINIFGNSSYNAQLNKSDYDERTYIKKAKDLCNSKNLIIFTGGLNIGEIEGIIKNKIYNGEYEGDEHSMYGLASMANSDKNTDPGSHLLVTIGTNKDGDIDQTDIFRDGGPCYPVGFADNILFSGRGFISQNTPDSEYIGEERRYTCSYPNYLNVAMTDLCFQLKPDIQDVDELLEMIRSTALTDYIRLDGQTQPLQLINPAGVFKKYLTPISLPAFVSTSDNTALKKGYYHGFAFDIPGAEVKINGEWIRYNDENKALILAQNPFTLEWRLNGDLLRKLGYKPGDIVKGTIIAVDDQWNGLSLSTEFTISLKK